MKPISNYLEDFKYWGEENLPGIILIILYFVIWWTLFIPRIIVCLLLPMSASYPRHPLHKIKNFWGFDND